MRITTITTLLYAACASAWIVEWHSDKACKVQNGLASGTKVQSCKNFDSDVTIQSVSGALLSDTWRVTVYAEKNCGGIGEEIDNTQDICIRPGIWKGQNKWYSYKVTRH